MNRKTQILFLLLFIKLTLLNCQESKTDLYKYNIYGFKMNQSIEEVKNYLKKSNKDFNIKKETDFLDETIEYIVISPKDQNIREMLNIDYKIVFFNNKILSITKFNITDKFKTEILKDIGNYSIVKNEKFDKTEYHTDDYIFFFQDPGKSITIRNKNVLSSKWEKYLSNLDSQFLINRTSSLYVLDNYSSNTIRELKKDEKLEIYKKGKEEVIKGKKIIWYNVITMFQEYGWVPSSDVKIWDKQIYYITTVDNLRFRESQDLQSKIIRTLNKGDKLELIETGKTETIGDVQGNWVKVKTEQGEIGWCFDAYLEEVK